MNHSAWQGAGALIGWLQGRRPSDDKPDVRVLLTVPAIAEDPLTHHGE